MKFFNPPKVFVTSKKLYSLTVAADQFNYATRNLMDAYSNMLTSLIEKPSVRPDFEALLQSIKTEQSGVSNSVSAIKTTAMLKLLEILIRELIDASKVGKEKDYEQKRFEIIETLVADWDKLKNENEDVKNWLDAENFNVNIHNLKSRVRKNYDEKAASSSKPQTMSSDLPIHKPITKTYATIRRKPQTVAHSTTQMEPAHDTEHKTTAELITQLETIDAQLSKDSESLTETEALLKKAVTFFSCKQLSIDAQIRQLESDLDRSLKESIQLTAELQSLQAKPV